MSYNTIALCVNDQAFSSRVNAAIAQEQIAREEPAAPGNLLGDMLWEVACASDVEEAYAYALTAENPNPGGDETVITDAMILGHVQGNWPTR